MLSLINHWAEMASGHVRTGTLWEIVLTFLAPYLVSTATNVTVIQDQMRGEERP